MSMPRSRHIRTRIELAILLLLTTLCVCAVVQAKQSDKYQQIHINADAFGGSQDSGKITFTGDVKVNQGTFRADGAKGTAYTDPHDTSQWQRVVLTGSPAHFQQTQDSGTLVHGQAQTIDYRVSENTVILTGNATVVQEGRGSFHGAKLTYNTDTGEIEGAAAAGGRVHITLQPKSKPSTAPAGSTRAPVGANSTGAPTSAASAANSAALPAATTGTRPASASSGATSTLQPTQAPTSAPSAAPAPTSTTGTH
ncbi:MAG: lipopolysaccharide transport periplasmic protein LptA [Rhodanobacteraceae bacterium]